MVLTVEGHVAKFTGSNGSAVERVIKVALVTDRKLQRWLHVHALCEKNSIRRLERAILM